MRIYIHTCTHTNTYTEAPYVPSLSASMFALHCFQHV